MEKEDVLMQNAACLFPFKLLSRLGVVQEQKVFF